VLEDIFTVQSDIAEKVILQLQATILEPERMAIESQPTDNMEAYQAYLLGTRYRWASYVERNHRLAVELLERAVALDPGFAVAHAVLSEVHSGLYHHGHDSTTERLDQAKASAERALQLEPGLPEGHRALGYYYYWGLRDYDRALEEFAIAAEQRPNDPGVLRGFFGISKRQGRWDEAVEALERWRRVDPQEYLVALDSSVVYCYLRDFEMSEEETRRAIAIAPDRLDVYWIGIRNYAYRDGNTDRAWRLLESAPSLDSPHIEYLSLLLDLWDRKPGSALARLREMSIETFAKQSIYETRELLECIYLSEMGEEKLAKAACESAIVELARDLEVRPYDYRLHIALGRAYALLGQSEDAIRAGEHAVELMPISKDVEVGGIQAIGLAGIYTRVGETNKALDLIEDMLSIPSPLSVGLLHLDPVWDPLRDHPRFQALLEKYEER